MAIRVLLLENTSPHPIYTAEGRVARYTEAWDTYVEHGERMQSVVQLLERGDLHASADAWRRVDQKKVDCAYRAVIGEREEYREGMSLLQQARKHFGLLPPPPIPGDAPVVRDRRIRPSDSNEAWGRSTAGLCTGCGTTTISHSQRAKLHAAFRRHGDLFGPFPTRDQRNGAKVACWPQVTIAAKGVAEHINPWSQGGATNAGNLTNACAACNYSRGDTSMDLAGVAAYAGSHTGSGEKT